MNLERYLELPTKPVILTVGEKYRDHTLVIEYEDGEVARLDIGLGDDGYEKLSKGPLLDFMKDMERFDSEKQAILSLPTYLQDHMDLDEELSILFQNENSNIKQVWTMHF